MNNPNLEISNQLHASIMEVIAPIFDCEITIEEKMSIIITALVQTIAAVIAQNIKNDTDIPNLIDDLSKRIEMTAMNIYQLCQEEQSIQ